MDENLATQYAPSQRSDQDTIRLQRKILEESVFSVKQLYDPVLEIILIVNQNRQIVFFNRAFTDLIGANEPEGLYGLRPGEAIRCTNACINPAGCGTSEFCSQCGGVNTILSALKNQNDLRECRIMIKDGREALDLLVRSTPLEIRDQMFCIVAIMDISHENRRRALERIFFHDVMNTAESIRMFAKMLDAETNGGNAHAYRKRLLAGINQLTDQLNSQKTLLAAENNELEIKNQPLDGYEIALEISESLANRFPEHKIRVKYFSGTGTFKTDRRLLGRVLENMLLNAIEASSPKQQVTVLYGIVDGFAEFRVHNQASIPRESQLQIFQRSFTTKGAGRGLGTYSMKLLSERYLGGGIEFTSTPEQGTTFIARYPL